MLRLGRYRSGQKRIGIRSRGGGKTLLPSDLGCSIVGLENVCVVVKNNYLVEPPVESFYYYAFCIGI